MQDNFYLINLQEFAVQISLSVEDRVFGVLLGLIAMWIVFDQLWAPRAGVRMQSVLLANLRHLARLAQLLGIVDTCRENELKQAMMDLRALRETINNSLSRMNEQADAVQFETGPDGDRKLRERERMQTMQPAIRTIFLLEIALVQHRPGLAEHLRGGSLAHFEEASARLLIGIAERSGTGKPLPGSLFPRRLRPGEDRAGGARAGARGHPVAGEREGARFALPGAGVGARQDAVRTEGRAETGGCGRPGVAKLRMVHAVPSNG